MMMEEGRVGWGGQIGIPGMTGGMYNAKENT